MGYELSEQEILSALRLPEETVKALDRRCVPSWR